MAKSKEVKQAEALARKRAQFNAKLAETLEYAPGGKRYEDNVKLKGVSFAGQRNAEIQMLFGRYLREARLDSHGNELVYGLKTVYSEDDSVLKGFMATSILRDMAPKRRTQTGGEGLHDFLSQPDVESFN